MTFPRYPCLPASSSFLPQKQSIVSSPPSASLSTSTTGDETGSGVALGRGLESLPFLKLSPHSMEYWLCMTFIWMANRWYYCLRTWKLVSQEQHKAASLAWAFSCAFESVVSISQGIRGTGLWEMEFAGDQQQLQQRLSKKWPWCDLGVQITKIHFFPPFLPSFLFQIYWGLINVKEMCPWGFISVYIWTTTRIKGKGDFLFYWV